MSTPDPATTKWVPLAGGGGSSIAYENAWSAGASYEPGQVVVRNGVEYMAVNPSTGVAPGPAFMPTRVVVPSYGTSLPATPIDGEEAILVDSLTNPTYQWRFRYNAGSSSAYKWEFIGGSPKWAGLYGGAASSVAISAVGGHVALDPMITAPRAGDYWVTGRVSVARYAGTDTNNIFISIAGNTQAIIRVHMNYAQDAFVQGKMTGVALGGNLYMTAYCETTAGINTYDGAISAIPMRVS